MELITCMDSPTFSTSSPSSLVSVTIHRVVLYLSLSRLAETSSSIKKNNSMSSNCPAASAARNNDVFVNVTELIHQRLETSSDKDWERLKLCWGYLDCGDCHRSKGHCGWCAIVRLSSHLFSIHTSMSGTVSSICITACISYLQIALP